MNLTDAWHEVIVSGTIGAAFLTALCTGPLADKIGRKPTILIGSVNFAIGAVIMAFAGGKVPTVCSRQGFIFYAIVVFFQF